MTSRTAFILLKLCSDYFIPSLFNAAGEIRETLFAIALRIMTRTKFYFRPLRPGVRRLAFSSKDKAGNQNFKNINLISRPFKLFYFRNRVHTY
jgi:hypothetical protein